MNIFFLSRTIIFCCLFVSITIAQDTFTLEHKFSKGKTYRYRTVMNNSMSTDMKGFSTTTNNTSTVVSRFTVEAITPLQSFVILASVESLTILVNGKTNTSAGADKIGKRTRLTVTPHGVIERREIIDSIKMAGFDANKMLFINLLMVLPEKKLSAGSNWSDTRIDTMQSFGMVMINTTTTIYTVSGTGKKNGHTCVTISYKADGTMSGSGSPQGMTVTSTGTTKSDGTMYFDVEKGLAIADESSTNGTIKMEMNNGTSMTMTTTGSTIKTLVE